MGLLMPMMFCCNQLLIVVNTKKTAFEVVEGGYCNVSGRYTSFFYGYAECSVDHSYGNMLVT